MTIWPGSTWMGPEMWLNWPDFGDASTGGFFFFIFFKIKISKIYVCFEIFQKYPRSPPIGRQALSVFFFVQIRNEVPEKKGPVLPTGDRGLSPSPRAAEGACHPPGRPGYPPYKSSCTPLPSSFEPENSTKNPEKKREE